MSVSEYEGTAPCRLTNMLELRRAGSPERMGLNLYQLILLSVPVNFQTSTLSVFDCFSEGAVIVFVHAGEGLAGAGSCESLFLRLYAQFIQERG